MSDLPLETLKALRADMARFDLRLTHSPRQDRHPWSQTHA
jgi:hypothetical protein